MRWWVVPLLLACAAWAGCIASEAELERGSYRLALVQGEETPPEPPKGICTPAWNHSIDVETETLRYSNKYDFSSPPLQLISFRFTDSASHCAILNLLDDGVVAEQEMGAHGTLRLEWVEAGLLIPDGAVLAPGETKNFSYDSKTGHEGSFFIINYGTWPHAGLEPV